MMAEDETPPMRGGKILSRDVWFGLSSRSRFREFRHWWHRFEKKGYGRDIVSREEAREIYEDWERTHPPHEER